MPVHIIIKKRKTKVFIALILVALSSACLPFETALSPDMTLTPNTLAATPTPINNQPFSKSQGPLLLIETDFNTHHILDLATYTLYPFELPIKDPSFKLAQSVSPGGSELLLPLEGGEILIYDFKTKAFETVYPFQEEPSPFQPALAAQLAHQRLPNINLSEEELITAVENAFLQSNTKTKWHDSDWAFFFVGEDAITENHLYLFNRAKDESMRVESMPALVGDFQVSPDGNLVLVKKGYIFDPGTWQDDRYYLIDMAQNTATPLTLPENVSNPTLSWFTNNLIGITHHIDIVGGTDFSLLDVHSLETNLLIKGSFSGIFPIGNNILILQHNREAQQTILSLRKLDGQITSEAVIEDLCFFRAEIDPQHLLLNCEQESLILSVEDLTIETFDKPTSLFSPSPDRRFFLVLLREKGVKLCEDGLENCKGISLEATPSEFLWLPDSSGFLYRTPTSLYHFNLVNETSQFLISSDLFGDYRNLNASWISID